MFMEERQRDIVNRVNETGRIMVSEIQELYQISADCARRDLRVLESRGLLQRTHGGAIAARPKGTYPDATYNPEDLPEIKKNYLAVAKRAIECIEEHDVIYITTSSTGYYMAVNLPGNLSITVLTNSVTIAEVLRKKENISVIVLGGEMSHRGHCHDYYTIQMVKNIRIDKSFLSHSALSVEFGASIHNSAGVEFGKAVMESSSMNIGLYPSEKIGKYCMVDARVHLEKGSYCIEWIREFVQYALSRNINEIYFLEHTHIFKEYSGSYYGKQWIGDKLRRY